MIYGGYPGGLFKKFISLRNRSLLIIPAADATTGFVHINNVAVAILMISENNIKITTLIDINMSISEAIYFFGFRGLMINIPSRFIRLVLILLNKITINSIDNFQSLTTIVLMKIPSNLKPIGSGKIILRKILLMDFVRINKQNSLKFSIKKFIRVIEESNLSNDYMGLNKRQKYIYMKRLFEIYKLSLKNEI